MGGPPSDRADRTPAVLTDLSRLLAPTPKRSPEVLIDRVTVTVQAGSTAPPPTGPSVPIVAPPPVAPAAHVFRNPWASYHSRRD
jgi:hypothetical protein